jgi:hypothetical protein
MVLKRISLISIYLNNDIPSILIAKNLLTGSLKNRSIDNLEPQKKSISMKNSQFFDYLLYAKRSFSVYKYENSSSATFNNCS